LGSIEAPGVKRGRFKGEIRPSKRETEKVIKREKEHETKKGTAVEEACLTDLKNHQ